MMMKMVTIVSLFFLMPIITLANEGDPKCFDQKKLPVNMKSLSLSEVKELQAKLKSSSDMMSMSFTQSIYTPLRKKVRTIDGTGYFAKPAKVRWNKTKPKEEIVFDGKDLFTYREGEKTAFKFSAKGSQAEEFEKLTSLVLNMEALLDRYELMAALEDINKKIVVMKLEPVARLKPSQDLIEISTEISRGSNSVNKVCLAYKNGKIINYTFTNIKRQHIDPAVFVFTPAKGVELKVFD